MRPEWCKDFACDYQRSSSNICGGIPHSIEIHHRTINDKRVCLTYAGQVLRMNVNDADMEMIRWIFDSLDNKESSCFSKGESVAIKMIKK